MRTRPDAKRSVRDNARILLPPLMDRFLRHGKDVAHHPLRIEELHRMRLDGKSLRYVMEFFARDFGKEFAALLHELKHVLQVMGRIHDCDILLPKAHAMARDLHAFNRRIHSRSGQIPPAALEWFIETERQQRTAMFTEVSTQIDRWVAEDLTGRLRRTLIYPPFT